MDAIRFCEHKILLKPDRLAAPAGFREFWKGVKRVAEACKIRVDSEPDRLAFGERKVMFFDTAQADLFRNSFILRKRVSLSNGQAGGREITFKFRNADLTKARDMDVRSTVAGDGRIKFKEEILPPHEGVGFRSLYSHNFVQDSHADIGIHRRFAKLKLDFPALGTLAAADDAAIVLVNDVTVDELETDTGALDFGHDYQAKSSIAVWRANTREAPMIGEFSFQTKFGDRAAVDPGAREKALRFYQQIQSDLSDWVATGTTKTSLIYGAAAGRE